MVSYPLRGAYGLTQVVGPDRATGPKKRDVRRTHRVGIARQHKTGLGEHTADPRLDDERSQMVREQVGDFSVPAITRNHRDELPALELAAADVTRSQELLRGLNLLRIARHPSEIGREWRS